MVERDCNCVYIRGYHKTKDCAPLRKEERRKDNLVTRSTAFSLVEEFRKTGDLKKLLIGVSEGGWHFGSCNRYSRELFEQFLSEALDNCANRITTQRESDALGDLYKWIENRSIDLPDEEDAKYLLWTIIGDGGVSRQSGECFTCTVQDKVQELGKRELQEISDLCLSELDRREEKVPSIKMEAEP